MNLSKLEKKVARLVPRKMLEAGVRALSSAPMPVPVDESTGQPVPEFTQPPGAGASERGPARAPGGARAPRLLRAAPALDAEAPTTEHELVPNELEAGARDVRERLYERGASSALVERIVRGVLASGAKGAFAIDAAAELLGRAFPLEAAPRRAAKPHVLVFVGPTGAGKTSTLAKLGRRLGAAGRSVLYASFDPLGAGALATVGGPDSDVDRTELPLSIVRDADDLTAALRKAGQVDLVLVDTPGLSPRYEACLEELARSLEPIEALGTPHVYLVLPATMSRSALAIAARAFACIAPSAVVVTKLDETSEPAPALEEALHAGLPLAFLCDGQDVRAHLARASADRVADLFLRGRFA